MALPWYSWIFISRTVYTRLPASGFRLPASGLRLLAFELLSSGFWLQTSNLLRVPSQRHHGSPQSNQEEDASDSAEEGRHVRNNLHQRCAKRVPGNVGTQPLQLFGN